jgi:hypothetical protein
LRNRRRSTNSGFNGTPFGPFQDFHQACLTRGLKPHLARLTLARRIASITLLVWKKGVGFGAEHLKQQAA